MNVMEQVAQIYKDLYDSLSEEEEMPDSEKREIYYDELYHQEIEREREDGIYSG